jgi:hypothetical protein
MSRGIERDITASSSHSYLHPAFVALDLDQMIVAEVNADGANPLFLASISVSYVETVYSSIHPSRPFFAVL